MQDLKLTPTSYIVLGLLEAADGEATPYDLKQAMARRRTPQDKAALKSSLTSYMRSLQRCPAKIRAFFQAPTVRYAA